MAANEDHLEKRNRIMRAARHLSAWGMARVTNLHFSGRDFCGTSKGHQADSLAGRYNDAAIDEICVELRSTRAGSHGGRAGGFGVLESDRAPLLRKMAALRASIADKAEKLAAIKAKGGVNYAIENPMMAQQRELRALQAALDAIPEPSNPRAAAITQIRALMQEHNITSKELES